MLKSSPTTEQNDLLLQINKNCFKIPLNKIVMSIGIPILVAHAPIQVTPTGVLRGAQTTVFKLKRFDCIFIHFHSLFSHL